ncbi:carbohydrate ABC transporter permease [Lacrimispora sp. JR3]|uniref:carbohydrate ABC transporter permease n=1 Tax=Lacrimispora sinapis TaxID=3111456 RepID=UPI003748F708
MGKVRQSKGDAALNSGFYIFITLFSVFCLIPFLVVLGSSFTDEVTLVKEGYNIIPKKFSTASYRMVAQASDILSAYKVTIFTTVVGTALSMIFTCSVSYAMSIKNLAIRGGLAMFIYFTMLFNGGLVANYLMITKVLHLKNSIWVLILPNLVNAYNCLLMRNFFNGVPASLAESAKIDGANDITILFRIVLPVSTPGIATIGLFYALSYWNEWYKVLLYISEEKLYTLQYLIMSILRKVNYASTLPAGALLSQETLPTYGFRMAAVVVTIGPVIFLYPLLQKYFVQGLTVGSVKG